MALDQAHEQNSADINSDGGAVGLTQSPEALRGWVVAGPELVMMTSEFKASLERKHHKLLDTSHHEQTKSFQVTFGKQDKELVDVIEDMGKPTQHQGHRWPNCGIFFTSGWEQQYQKFMTDRLVEQTTPIAEPIKKNKLSFDLLKEKNPKKAFRFHLWRVTAPHFRGYTLPVSQEMTA